MAIALTPSRTPDTHDAAHAAHAPDAMLTARSEGGRTLAELSAGRDVLVVFLRHAGCTFCKEAIGDLGRARARLEHAGVVLAVVHMGEPGQLDERLAGAGLGAAERFSDPARALYGAMGLRRGTLRQLFGLKCFVRGVVATLRGHIVGRLVGDGFQMPGVFLVRDGRVVRAFRHESAADRPDYCELSGAAS
jgi:hypothetical protein